MVRALGLEKEATQKQRDQEQGEQRDMVAHSSIPAWRNPRTEEPGGQQSMGRKALDTTEAI